MDKIQLRASSAYRWIHCTASVEMERDYLSRNGEKEDSESAAHGKILHEYCKNILLESKNNFDKIPLTVIPFIKHNEHKKDKNGKEIDHSLAYSYCEFIIKNKAKITLPYTHPYRMKNKKIILTEEIEKDLFMDLGKNYELKGTPDYFIITNDKYGTISVRIVDLKTGNRKFGQSEYYQMYIYALLIENYIKDNLWAELEYKPIEIAYLIFDKEINEQINQMPSNAWKDYFKIIRSHGMSFDQYGQIDNEIEDDINDAIDKVVESNSRFFYNREGCLFCKAKSECSTYASRNLITAKNTNITSFLTKEELKNGEFLVFKDKKEVPIEKKKEESSASHIKELLTNLKKSMETINQEDYELLLEDLLEFHHLTRSLFEGIEKKMNEQAINGKQFIKFKLKKGNNIRFLTEEGIKRLTKEILDSDELTIDELYDMKLKPISKLEEYFGKEFINKYCSIKSNTGKLKLI